MVEEVTTEFKVGPPESHFRDTPRLYGHAD
jgi:hypothetical protein